MALRDLWYCTVAYVRMLCAWDLSQTSYFVEEYLVLYGKVPCVLAFSRLSYFTVLLCGVLRSVSYDTRLPTREMALEYSTPAILLRTGSRGPLEE